MYILDEYEVCCSSKARATITRDKEKMRLEVDLREPCAKKIDDD